MSAYDRKICQEKIKQMAIQTFIIGVIHFQWAYLIPLLISPTMALMNLLDDKLIAIYILGKNSKTDTSLSRPFAAPKGLFLLLYIIEPLHIYTFIS